MALDRPLPRADLSTQLSVSAPHSNPIGLLWQHHSLGAVSDWQVQNGQVLSMAAIVSPGSDWQLVGNGDFNQDAQLDLVWRNPQTGQNHISLNGLQATDGRIELATLPGLSDRQWQVATVQDFNQDGNADIFWRHQETGENRLWLMTSRQIKVALELPAVTDLAWQFGGVGDFNQDGSLDLLWRNQVSGINHLWLMEGVQPWQGVNLLRLEDPDWHIAGVVDMNQDQQVDILWRHTSGLNGSWLMQGMDYQAAMSLAPVPDRDWQVATIVTPARSLSAPTTIGEGLTKPTADALPTPLTNNLLNQVTVPTTALLINATFNVNVQLNQAGLALNQPNESVKLSYFLSNDASISRNDLLLDAVIIDQPNLPLSLDRPLKLPDRQSPFWQLWEDNPGLSKTVYIGVSVELLGSSAARLQTNEQQVQSITFSLPPVMAYEFIYYYDGTNQTGDSYRGTVLAYDGMYQVGGEFDSISDRTQANTNGIYKITDRRAIQLAENRLASVGDVQVTAYYDAETQTSYVPLDVVGRNYLGSEAGYIRAQRSNTDRFGYDFYEADVWLTRPPDPMVGVAPRSTDLIVRSLLNPFLNYWDTRENGGIITYSFYRELGIPYYGNEQVSELNDAVKRNVRKSLSLLETQLNIRFVEVEETVDSVGVIRYLGSNGEGNPFYAYTYYPDTRLGGDVHLNANFAEDTRNGFSAEPGSYGYRSLLHETLHALGLKHPGNYDAGSGSGAPPFLYAEDDNTTNTIMSYNVVGFNPITVMDYDLIALQYLYGGRSYRNGNSNYQFTSLSSYLIGGENVGLLSQPAKQTLWDSGGKDTLDFSQLPTNASNVFDLRPGGILTARSAYNAQYYTNPDGLNSFTTSDYGIKLADEVLLEELVNSMGNDYVVANRANNQFLGYRLGRSVGNDEIEFADGADVVVLANYRLVDLKVTIDRNDLILNLAGDGTIRLNDYLSYRNPVRVKLGNDYYQYRVSQGWQRTTAPPVVRPEVNIPKGVAAQQEPVTQGLAVANDLQRTTASVDQQRCHCSICRTLPQQLLQHPSLEAIALRNSA
jgi:hypothetical protein